VPAHQPHKVPLYVLGVGVNVGLATQPHLLYAHQLGLPELLEDPICQLIPEDIVTGQSKGTSLLERMDGLLEGQGGGVRGEFEVRSPGEDVAGADRIDEEPDDWRVFVLLVDSFLEGVVEEIVAEDLTGVGLDDLVHLHVCMCTTERRKLGSSLW
jgi:hypothetical protein